MNVAVGDQEPSVLSSLMLVDSFQRCKTIYQETFSIGPVLDGLPDGLARDLSVIAWFQQLGTNPRLYDVWQSMPIAKLLILVAVFFLTSIVSVVTGATSLITVP